jgi:hypothetical protein
MHQQVKKEHPFSSKIEANARLKVLLYSLNKFEVKNESNQRFVKQLADLLHNKVYESEAFDEHLDFEEYLVLRDITNRL